MWPVARVAAAGAGAGTRVGSGAAHPNKLTRIPRCAVAAVVGVAVAAAVVGVAVAAVVLRDTATP